MFHKWFWVDFRKGAASQTAEKSASSLDLYGVLTLRTKLVNRVISLTLTVKYTKVRTRSAYEGSGNRGLVTRRASARVFSDGRGRHRCSLLAV